MPLTEDPFIWSQHKQPLTSQVYEQFRQLGTLFTRYEDLKNLGVVIYNNHNKLKLLL